MKVCDFLVGIIVLWGMSFVIIFLIVLIFWVSGVMFNKRIFLVLLSFLFESILFCIAASYVIVLLGLIFLFGFLLLKKFWRRFWIFGIWVELLINIILLILFFFMFALFMVFLIGFMVLRKRLLFSFLNWVWVRGLEKLILLKRVLILICIWCWLERVCLVFLVLCLSFCIVFTSFDTFLSCLRLMSFMKYFMICWLKFLLFKWVFLFVEMILKILLLIVRIDTSNVFFLRLKIRMFFSFFLFNLYVIVVVVGLLMMWVMFKLVIILVFFVVWCCVLLKYVGIVTTACLIFLFRYVSAVFFIFVRIIVEIFLVWKIFLFFLSLILMYGLLFLFIILNGNILRLCCIFLFVNFWLMSCFVLNIVWVGLVDVWFLVEFLISFLELVNVM